MNSDRRIEKRLAFLDLMIQASEDGTTKLSDDDIREEVDTVMFAVNAGFVTDCFSIVSIELDFIGLYYRDTTRRPRPWDGSSTAWRLTQNNRSAARYLFMILITLFHDIRYFFPVLKKIVRRPHARWRSQRALR